MQIASFTKSLFFVLIQFACLGLIALSGPLIPRNAVLFVVELLGIGLGIWAILSMRIGNFNIAPDPLKHSKLVTTGPYRMIRHPMYLAILITTLPLIIFDIDLFRILLWLVLLIDLLFKLNYEESLLLEQVIGYDQYTRQSYRLIPFLY